MMRMKNFIWLLAFIPALAFTQNMSLIESLEGTSSHVNGPNCWNGALVVAGVLRHKRMLHPDEWLYHLEHSCVEVEVPEAGDVGRIFHHRDGEVHGFIYLNEDMIFAKHAEQSQYGFQTMSYLEMMNQYGRTRACKINRDDSPDCDHQVKYYRCSRAAELPQAIEDVNALFESLTFSQETRWRFKMDCEGDVHRNREELYTQIQETLRDADTTQIDSDLLQALTLSYREQAYRLQVSDRNFRCRPRALRLERSQAYQLMSQEIRMLSP
jgi:hypothetical protein